MKIISFAHTVSILLVAAAPATAVATEQALRDPMQPPSYLATSAESAEIFNNDMKLQTTYVSDQGSHAVINNQVVREGEEINNHKIMSIKPGEVTLDRNGDIITLTVLPTGLKRRPTGAAR